MGNNCRVTRIAFQAGFACLAVLCLVLAGCGGGGRSPELIPADTVSAGSTAAPALEADSLAVPQGVDPELWSRLVAELKSASAGLRHTGPPLNAVNQVTDLVLAEAEEGGYLLSWGYLNTGDYNYDGLVNASDMTPVGIYYGKSTADADWPQSQVADGNGDGTVGLSDITTIGQNYGNKVAGYLLEISATPEDADSWEEVTRVAISDSEVADKLPSPRFVVPLASFSYDGYYRVTPYRAMTGWIERGIDGAPVLLAEDKRGHWWMEGGDNHHSSYSCLPGPLTNHLWWSVEIGGEGKSGPVLDSQGRIYVGGEAGLYIVEPDGSSFSCHATPEPVETTPALAHDGTVYFGCLNGNLYALGADRVLKWIFHASAPLTNSPAIADDGTIWFADEAGTIYAIAPDGTVLEEVDGTSGIKHSPAIDAEGRAYFKASGDTLLHIPDSGFNTELKFVWPVLANLPLYTSTDQYGTYGYIKREAFLSSNPSGIEAISTACFSGSEDHLSVMFPETETVSERAPMATPEGLVFLMDEDNHLMRFSVPEDESNQAVKDWHTLSPLTSGDFTAIVDCNGMVYLTKSKDRSGIQGISPDGSPLWVYPKKSYIQPVVAPGNTLLVISTAGELLAIGGEMDQLVPDPVEDFEVTCAKYDHDRITLDWDQSNGATAYEVFRNGETIPIVTIDGSEGMFIHHIEWTDIGLEPGTLYSYSVRAINDSGTGESSPVVDARTYLARPELATASYLEYPSKIELSWQASAGAQGYRIYRDSYFTNSEPVALLGQELVWTDYTVVDWDTHTYSIVSFNSDTQSGAENVTGAIIRGLGDTGAGGWRMVGGDSGKRRLAGVSGPEEPDVGWQRVLNTPFKASLSELNGEPVFGNEGAIYLAGNPGSPRMLALHPDGSLRWTAGSSGYCPVVLDDGTIAVGDSYDLEMLNPNGRLQSSTDAPSPSSLIQSPDGSLIGIRRRWIITCNSAGEILWDYHFAETPVSNSLVADGTGAVFVAEYHDPSADPYGDGSTPPPNHPERIYAFSPSGTVTWMTAELQYNYSMCLGNPGMLFACFDDSLHALDTADGSITWSYPLTGDLAVNASGQVICAGDDELVVLNPDGTLAWSYLPPEGFSVSYPIVDAAGTVFFNEVNYGESGTADNKNRLVALDFAGNYSWSYEQTGCSGHAIKSIRDDGALLWYTKNGEDNVPTLTLIAP